jgi:hypothetical protein
MQRDTKKITKIRVIRKLKEIRIIMGFECVV